MIGDRIKTLRESAGMTQVELAKKLDISRTSINAWENGISEPSAAYIIELAKLFHSSADYILELDDTQIVDLSGYSHDETKLVRSMLEYFDAYKPTGRG